MGTTSISNSWTGDKCCISWIMNTVFRLSLAWAITWPSWPRVVTYAGSSSKPSRFWGLVAVDMVVVPQTMRARPRYIYSHPSLINSMWILSDVSGLDMAHKYWLDVRAFGLSNNTLDFKAIRCGCMLSIVAIKVCIANAYNGKSASSNFSCWARCRDRPMSFSAVDHRRTTVVWFGVLRPCLELMSHPAMVGYLLASI